jgi:cwf21 domain
LQVEVAVMEFRDELEEGGGLSRQQIDDRVRVKRAQLTVEAEREAAAAAAASRDDGRASSRCRSLFCLPWHVALAGVTASSVVKVTAFGSSRHGDGSAKLGSCTGCWLTDHWP